MFKKRGNLCLSTAYRMDLKYIAPFVLVDDAAKKSVEEGGEEHHIPRDGCPPGICPRLAQYAFFRIYNSFPVFQSL